jgi:NAD(P)-dependent dehydrogenase (short-subunit alcohol dehydrogenase family)
MDHLTTGPGRLAGRVALITGGGSGIGLATAIAMAQAGAATVVIAGRREAEGERAAAAITGLGAQGVFTRTDVTNDASIETLVASTIERFGRLDIAFNNAGWQEPRASLADQSTDTYARIFDTNVRSAFICMRAQIRAMMENGRGTIINNASVSGIRNPNPGLSLYSASKAAVISMTRSAALEYGPSGIRINGVSPGRVETDMMLNSAIADMKLVAAGLPLRRLGQPSEVANAVVWLASDEASFVTGHILNTDGGFLAS